MRGSTMAFLLCGGLAALAAGCLVHAASTPRDAGFAYTLTAQLGLTDLALFNEARYTRHPALADLHTAFQDGPSSLDHFPSGSLLTPPRHGGGRLDRTAP
jgi:hypothetical protein